MVYVVDIDGTICESAGGDYSTSIPIESRIQKVNKLYEDGHTIVMLTARGMGRSNGDQKVAEKLMRDVTEKQLKSWGLKYHSLYFGKPSADFYIDDKAKTDKDFFDDQR
jgi:histidinol phosphatase-like enzyme